MNKWFMLVLAFLSVPMQAYCNDMPTIPTGEITLVQISSPPSQTGAIRQPAPPRPPAVNTPPAGMAVQVNPSLVAVRKMLDAARQMDGQCRSFEREFNKIPGDPVVMKDQLVKKDVITIQGTFSCTQIRNVLVNTLQLQKDMERLLTHGPFPTQGTQSAGSLSKGGPATLPKGGPAK